MAYTAWSVVFGEQPTAAKWNQLGTNDAGFRDGSNMAWTNPIVAGAASHIDLQPAANKLVKIAVRRQNDTTNTFKNQSIIMTGWGTMQYSGAAVAETVNYGITFDEIPIVVASFAGDKATSGTYGDGGNTVEGRLNFKTIAQTTSSFQAMVHQGGAASFAAGWCFYTWIAIGVYSG